MAKSAIHLYVASTDEPNNPPRLIEAKSILEAQNKLLGHFRANYAICEPRGPREVLVRKENGWIIWSIALGWKIS